MRPRYYTIKNGKTTFHYHMSDWRAFLQKTKEQDTIGAVLMDRIGYQLHYRMINDPACDNFTLMHNEPFWGKMPTDDELCREPIPKKVPLESYSFHIIDLSK